MQFTGAKFFARGSRILRHPEIDRGDRDEIVSNPRVAHCRHGVLPGYEYALSPRPIGYNQSARLNFAATARLKFRLT
jgi:hypothetical protein